MKITLTKEDLKKVKTLSETKDRNIEVADMYLYFLSNAARSISKEAIDDVMLAYACNESTAYYRLMMDALGIDLNNKKYQRIGTDYCLKGIQELNPKKYRDNPYYKNIHTTTIKSKNWEIGYQPYLPYEGFVYDDVTVEDNHHFLEISHLGFFEETFSYLAVSEGDVIWMSVTPNEIETMQPVINQVKGKVITFGLGLGYFAYMASIKDDVESVTIIEKNKDIIALFNKYILPQFSHKEKIKIVNADAFEYATKEMPKHHFDEAFVDLWHGAEDGVSLYVQMKKLERLNSGTKFSYWLEKSLIAMLRRCVLVVLEEQLDGSSDSDYQKAETDIDKIINQLYFYFKEFSIAHYEDIIALLKDDVLKEIALKI